MSAEAKLRVTIESAATGSGIPQTAAGLKDVAASAQKAGPALQQAGAGAKEMGAGLGKAVEVGGATTALMQSLSQVSQGGAAGFFAIGRSILAFGQIVKGVLLGAGPVGLAVAAIGLLVGAVIALKDAFAAPKKPVEDLGKAIDDLNKQRANTLQSWLDGVAASANAARDAMEAVLAIKEARVDADEDIAIAQVRADDTLTTEQRLRAEQAVRQQAAARRESVAEMRRGQDISDASKSVYSAEKVLEDQREAAAAAAKRKAELEAVDPESRRAALAAAREQMTPSDVARLQAEAEQRANRASVLYSASGSLLSSPEKREQRLREADAEWTAAEQIRQRLDPSRVPDYAEDEKAKKEANLAAARLDATKQAEALDAAEKALADTRAAKASLELKRTTEIDVNKIKAEAKTATENVAIKSEQAKAAAEIPLDPKQIAAAQRMGYSATANRYAVAPSADAARLLREAFPDQADASDKLIAAKTPRTLGQTLAAPPPPVPTGPGGTVTIGGVTTTIQAGGQPTGPGRGAYREDDDKSAKVTNALKGTTEAVQSQPTGDEQAKAAEELKKATEEQTKAQRAANDATARALTSTAEVLQSHSSGLTSHGARLSRLESQIAAQRGKKYA